MFVLGSQYGLGSCHEGNYVFLETLEVRNGHRELGTGFSGSLGIFPAWTGQVVLPGIERLPRLAPGRITGGRRKGEVVPVDVGAGTVDMVVGPEPPAWVDGW